MGATFDDELPGVALTSTFVKGGSREADGNIRNGFKKLIILLNVF